MSEPLLSVVIPAYNMAEHTVLTVRSVLAQDHPVEVIVVDDGSKDGTPARLRAEFGDAIRVVEQANGGACRARNAGLALSRGELVAFLDCDDLWEPGKARRCAEYLGANPEAAMVHSWAYWIDGAGRIVGPRRFEPRPSGRVFERLVLDNFVVNSTPVLRRSALEKAGAWDEAIFTTADWDLWLRLAKLFPIGFIPEVLARTRLASYYNARNIDRTRREWVYALDKHRADLPPGAYDQSLANMSFYLSRLHAANGDFAAAQAASREALRLAPGRRKFRLASFLYSLGGPLNRVLSRALECYTLLACRWQIRRKAP